MYSTAWFTISRVSNSPDSLECRRSIPLWMASASLSGISMLNSCGICEHSDSFCGIARVTNLLDGHDDLDGVKRVETEVVGEV